MRRSTTLLLRGCSRSSSSLRRPVALRSSAAQVPAPPPMQPAQPRDAAPAVKGTAAIIGRVTNLETGGPLRRAVIRITSPALPSARRVSTNSDGRYEVRDLPARRVFAEGGTRWLPDARVRTAAARRGGQAAPARRRADSQGDRFRPPTHGRDQRARRRRDRRADRKGQHVGDAVRPPSGRAQAHPVRRPGRMLRRGACVDGRERAVFAGAPARRVRGHGTESRDVAARSRIRRRCSATRHRSIQESSSQPKRSA